MYLASYQVGTQTHWGVVDIDRQCVHPISSVFGEYVPPDLLSYIVEKGCDSFSSPCLSNFEDGLPLSSIEIVAPINNPVRNIFCVGKNYTDHVKELSKYDKEQFDYTVEKPVFFTKPTTSVNGPYADVPAHETMTSQLDYEAELAVIIGKDGVNIPVENALDYVFGYTIINDVTARDVQRAHKQWVKGKGLDGFCPMGPWIVTRDDITDPQNINIKSFVNGELRQSSNTSKMIHSIAQLISELSQGLTLKAGDILATGTPEGVGAGFNPPKFLAKGDIVRIEIDDIGAIENTVI
jgi:2-keto-4-pentenoate hydratase/2-oxohepta-3-ene-1,7-dioic acid hydratase in catechol pathway